MKQDYLVIDIETVPHRLDEYKTLFPNSKKKGGLHSIISEVVCICIADSSDEITTLDRRNHSDEETILCDLRQILWENNTAKLVGFNVKAFDFSFLTMRGKLYGILLNLPETRSQRVVDIYEAIGGRWATDISSCSLRELIWFMYGEVTETQGGNMVAEWYANGELSEIASHCEEDVRYTKRLYKDLYMNGVK